MLLSPQNPTAFSSKVHVFSAATDDEPLLELLDAIDELLDLEELATDELIAKDELATETLDDASELLTLEELAIDDEPSVDDELETTSELFDLEELIADDELDTKGELETETLDEASELLT